MFRLLLLGAVLFGLIVDTKAQGLLTPPGAPAPTMKTLEQIEARTDLNKLAGDAATVCIINGPGSYYLTADLSGASGKDTIRVATGGRVTIDLNGFAILNTGSGRTAILLPSANDAIVVRNGIIRAGLANNTVAIGGTGTGVLCEDLTVVSGAAPTIILGDNGVVRRCRLVGGGISLGNKGVVSETQVDAAADNVSIELGDDAQVRETKLITRRGWLSVGERGQVTDCQVNSGGPPTFLLNATVLQTGGSSVVRSCTVKGGTLDNAIGVGRNSVVSHCRVASVFRDGITANVPNVTVESCAIESFGRHGITLGANARVRDCTVNGANPSTGATTGGADGITVGENSIVSGSTVTAIGGIGIIAGDGCTITESTASENNGDGIQAGDQATIQNCNARSNQGNGIMVAGSSSVRNCVVALNGKKTSPNNAAADGIEMTNGRTRVIDCEIFSNAQHGISSASTNNRNFIEGCLLHSNGGFGISLQGASNTVIKNQVGGNTGGMINVSGGNIAPVQSASDPAASMHPLANYL